MKNKYSWEWVAALKTMRNRQYWNRPNTVEFFGFFVKALIILPGLVFGIQIWWLYIFALVSSLAIIWSSTVKTIPTLIWFNLVWSIVAFLAIAKHFLG